ncbi:efflux RND transporter periplasmic adaptor subunit [Orrella daihaiensis]|uniref:Efflux RND transporter periplasmic adaptor subunit n=1 Tax=Orrella daihaiensis TaxID=2782176 RepID=A0ABY4AI50_9BURK|nr:efflux RND transporter periplasmic adaptor subunit [Orrella daihaiensis]UOD49967.1 efflux RND transporter periplasmic adaptor subunit [Orrella daihaiensis]
MMNSKLVLSTLILTLALAGCNDGQTPLAANNAPPVVRTMPIESAQNSALRLSGTIEAARQNLLSFQIGGRITERLVNAGDRVNQGQLLFALDERDLSQATTAARAQAQAAASALETAQDELTRAERLFKSRFVSEQALDQAKLRLAEAQTRLDAANSSFGQATNALSYAKLSAPADGVVTEVVAEIGQVVAPGQVIGEFAFDGQLEIEVFLPQGLVAPDTGTVSLGQSEWPAVRREVSGAADPSSRTFRARYTLPADITDIPIGTIADLLLPIKASAQIMQVPLGAIDERGQGPRVWIVENGKTKSVPIKILSMSHETAQIQGELPVGTPVVAMGTHLLETGMAVRVQPR